jgi:Adenylate and Guanylate cyclase catalytic domain
LIRSLSLVLSCFIDRVENNALPAAFAIHKSLKTELSVDNRIGCTFGKVYCGVVGGVRRHEFAVMGAPVNLAARLMGSKVNNGILVDEAVREQCMGRYTFKSLPPVTAKGYDKPVPILEPVHSDTKANKKKKSSFPIIGRRAEKRTVISVARGIIEEPMIAQSTMIFLTGESGMGKSALAITILDEVKKGFAEERAVIVTARSSSTETEQRIPLG